MGRIVVRDGRRACLASRRRLSPQCYIFNLIPVAPATQAPRQHAQQRLHCFMSCFGTKPDVQGRSRLQALRRKAEIFVSLLCHWRSEFHRATNAVLVVRLLPPFIALLPAALLTYRTRKYRQVFFWVSATQFGIGRPL